jgi:hypothetical protein
VQEVINSKTVLQVTWQQKEHALIAPKTASNSSANGFVDITETTWQLTVNVT